MKKDVRKRIFTRLQASAVIFALMLGWLSPVAPLMANEPDFCSMECCVAEGHCCCADANHLSKDASPARTVSLSFQRRN
jgi:hypothetical protein